MAKMLSDGFAEQKCIVASMVWGRAKRTSPLSSDANKHRGLAESELFVFVFASATGCAVQPQR